MSNTLKVGDVVTVANILSHSGRKISTPISVGDKRKIVRVGDYTSWGQLAYTLEGDNDHFFTVSNFAQEIKVGDTVRVINANRLSYKKEYIGRTFVVYRVSKEDSGTWYTPNSDTNTGSWRWESEEVELVSSNGVAVKQPFEEIEVQINHNYKAVISTNWVTIGSFRLTFDKFRELAGVIEEQKTKHKPRYVAPRKPLLTYDSEGKPNYNKHAFEKMRLEKGDLVNIPVEMSREIVQKFGGSYWPHPTSEDEKFSGRKYCVTSSTEYGGSYELDNGNWFAAIAVELVEYETAENNWKEFHLVRGYDSYVGRNAVYVGCQTYPVTNFPAIMKAIEKAEAYNAN